MPITGHIIADHVLNIALASLIIDVALLSLWIYVLYQANLVAEKLYGTEYTPVLVYFVAAIGLLTMLRILESFYQHILISGTGYSHTFIFSLQTIQVVAGILLLSAFYGIYTMSSATAGIGEVGSSE